MSTLATPESGLNGHALNGHAITSVRLGPPPEPPEDDHRPKLVGAWNADALLAAEFPEPRWAVPGLIPEGVTLAAGPPKVGKSWLMLGVALAVASGGMALGRIPVDQGDVLYLALEDTARRLQHRMRTMLDGTPAPGGLTVATGCPPLPEGGTDAIVDWIAEHPNARMIVIDVFAKLRGRTAPGASAYDADYAAVSRAKAIADHYGLAVVLVHHVRKAGSDDFLHEVSGTNGLAGAADTTLVLKRARGAADATLHITGRDVDEAEHALEFHPENGTWTMLNGPAEQHALPDTRAAIIRYVTANPGQRPKAIAAALELGYDNVKRTCARMAQDGQLRADNKGAYHPITTTDPELFGFPPD